MATYTIIIIIINDIIMTHKVELYLSSLVNVLLQVIGAKGTMSTEI